MIFLIIFFAVVFIFLLTVLVGAPYVPSLKNNLRLAFTDLYQLSDKDLLVDIGSGGGVVLREAAKLGARAVGYEINPFLVIASRLLSYKNSLVKVKFANYWHSHLPDGVTVVYVFSVDRDINKIASWMQSEVNRIKRPIYFISLGFKIKGMTAIKYSESYGLYVFNPLQLGEAQV